MKLRNQFFSLFPKRLWAVVGVFLLGSWFSTSPNRYVFFRVAWLVALGLWGLYDETDPNDSKYRKFTPRKVVAIAMIAVACVRSVDLVVTIYPPAHVGIIGTVQHPAVGPESWLRAPTTLTIDGRTFRYYDWNFDDDVGRPISFRYLPVSGHIITYTLYGEAKKDRNPLFDWELDFNQ